MILTVLRLAYHLPYFVLGIIYNVAMYYKIVDILLLLLLFIFENIHTVFWTNGLTDSWKKLEKGDRK